jgi:protein-S-isoprenylcysteine O-methyltransferase Ste14
MDYLWLIVLWLIYFSLHSITATSHIKNRAFSLGIKIQQYRVWFNIIALATLIPILIFSSSIRANYVFQPHNLTTIAGFIIAGIGIFMGKMAFKSYDLKAFLGLGNLRSEEEFSSDGLLSFVRHPLYTGSILLILGYFIINPKLSSLISALMLVIYILVGIQFEEKKLIKAFGDDYLEYRKKTPMLIPRFWEKK